MIDKIEFQTADRTWVMRITADRRIEVNEDVEVTDAAQKVLDAMQHLLNPATRRQWVGLTEAEIMELVEMYSGVNPNRYMLIKDTQYKLKEKNHG